MKAFMALAPASHWKKELERERERALQHIMTFPYLKTDWYAKNYGLVSVSMHGDLRRIPGQGCESHVSLQWAGLAFQKHLECSLQNGYCTLSHCWLRPRLLHNSWIRTPQLAEQSASSQTSLYHKFSGCRVWKTFLPPLEFLSSNTRRSRVHQWPAKR